MPKGESEKLVQRRILDWLIHEEIFAWRNNSGLLFIQGRRVQLGATGSPDIIGIMPDGSGRFFGIEVKGSRGRQNPNQIEFERQVKKWNGVYIVAHSLEEAINGMYAVDRREVSDLNDFLSRTEGVEAEKAA
jgi:hypothetical protein